MKHIKAALKYGPVAGLALLAQNAMATGPDFSVVTNAVDWTAVGVAILTILAAGTVVVVSLTGGKSIVHAIKGSL